MTSINVISLIDQRIGDTVHGIELEVPELCPGQVDDSDLIELQEV